MAAHSGGHIGGMLLVTQTQLLDECRVALEVFFLEVGQEAAAAIDHGNQPALGAVVLLMNLHVLGELGDAPRQNGDLHFAGTAVLLVKPVLFNQFGFGFFIHFSSL